MLRSLEVQRVNRIKLSLSLMHGRWVLDQPAVTVLLAKSLGGDWVIVLVEQVEHVNEGMLVVGNHLVRRHLQITFTLLFGDVRQPANGGWIAAVTQGRGQLEHSLLCHAIQNVIGLGVEQQ